MAILTQSELIDMNFADIGENVFISNKASFYNCRKISIGNNVRIDDFCVISAGHGGIYIGNNIHLAVYSSIIGAEKVVISDFANISSRVSIYSSSDDYSGTTMTNPMIPDEFKSVTHAPVYIGRHVIIGSGSIVLPNVTLEEGVAIGSLSLVNRDCARFSVYAGIPVKKIKERKTDLLDLEKKYLISIKAI